jgi:acyl-coenzyme A thioesterase PaaI-like protein
MWHSWFSLTALAEPRVWLDPVRYLSERKSLSGGSLFERPDSTTTQVFAQPLRQERFSVTREAAISHLRSERGRMLAAYGRVIESVLQTKAADGPGDRYIAMTYASDDSPAAAIIRAEVLKSRDGSTLYRRGDGTTARLYDRQHHATLADAVCDAAARLMRSENEVLATIDNVIDTPAFSLGDIRTTSAVSARLSQWQIGEIVARHRRCDWGEQCAHDRDTNDLGVVNGDRLLSSYAADGETLFVITEANREVTTVLFASEY